MKKFKDINKAREYHNENGGILYILPKGYGVGPELPTEVKVFPSQEELAVFCLRLGQCDFDETLIAQPVSIIHPMELHGIYSLEIKRFAYEEGEDWAVVVNEDDNHNHPLDTFFKLDYPCTVEQLACAMGRILKSYKIACDINECTIEDGYASWAISTSP